MKGNSWYISIVTGSNLVRMPLPWSELCDPTDGYSSNSWYISIVTGSNLVRMPLPWSELCDPTDGYSSNSWYISIVTGSNLVRMPLPWSELCDPTDGYSPRWGGTEEFIEDITYRIWEQGDLEVIKETYSDTCPVITLSGLYRLWSE